MHAGQYRSDIDGLRTVAVLPVILFHLGLSQFPGGFVGVDVFFVISGFLITGVIHREIGEGNFSIVRFYERRARRILPALMVMILFCGVAGWFLFVPENFKRLGSSMAAAALFSSNVLFWLKTDYFAGPAELEPLIHTWSLAVEEQYYILFPLLLMALSRLRRPRYMAVTWALALASFGISVWMTFHARSGAYYLPHSRAWELLAGSLLALGAVPAIHRHRMAELAAFAGLAAVLAGIFLLDGSAPFPGYNALWPTVGAALILHAGSSGHRTLVARLLGSRPFVWTGLISYSLYLWHWPLIVFARYQKMGELDGTDRVVILALTFALAWASWRYIERPCRNRHKVSRNAIFAGAGASLAVVALSGGAIYASNGVSQRFVGVARPHLVRADMPQPGEPNCFIEDGKAATEIWAGDSCVLTRGNGKAILLWGDSHAYQYRHVMAGLAAAQGRTLVLYTAAGCPPIFDTVIPARPLCAPSHERIADIVRRYDVGRVILSGDWEAKMAANGIALSQLQATIARLQQLGTDIRMVGDNPRFDFQDIDFIGMRLARQGRLGADYTAEPANNDMFNQRLRALVGPSRFVDPRTVLCPASDQCLIYAGGKAVMGDGSHLSVDGTQRMAPALAPLFR